MTLKLSQCLQIFWLSHLDLQPAYRKTHIHTHKRWVLASSKLLGLGVLKKFGKKWKVSNATEDIIYVKMFWFETFVTGRTYKKWSTSELVLWLLGTNEYGNTSPPPQHNSNFISGIITHQWSKKELVNWRFYNFIEQQICQIIIYIYIYIYIHWDQRSDSLYLSFFVTSQTYPTRLDRKECDLSETHRIQLRPFLPIRGSNPITLRFGVTQTFDQGQTLPERCLITLQPGEEMEWTNISVQAVCDNTNQEFSPQVFTFSVVSFTDFWFGYELPAITVSPAVRTL